MKLVEALNSYTCLEADQIKNIINKAPMHYKMYFIKKKNGGNRQIFHPSKTTKMLQYALIDLYLSKIIVHKSAIAYKCKNSEQNENPIKFNAIKHAAFKYSIHLDFKDFFPSIKPEDFWNKVQSIDELMSFTVEEKEYFNHIVFITFRGDTFLSIGAPSSPIISNIFMIKFDELIETFTHRSDINGVYTRYADDIWISSDDIAASRKSLDYVMEVLQKEYQSQKLNEKKTYFCSRKGKRIITGLTVTPEGDVVIPQSKKRYIRSLIYNYTLQNVDDKTVKYIKGYISFIKDVEPTFLNSLLIKYGEKMHGLL